jgi:predicted molibdopterin-dependent oxidoreductase YjgC
MKEITVNVNGRQVIVPEGTSVAAAVFLAGEKVFRTSLTGQPRSSVCGMGICFECRVTIDDQPHQRACSRLCRPGMEIQTQ